MGLFALVKVAEIAIDIASNKEVQEALTGLTVKGLKKLEGYIDTDGDGDFDETDLKNLIEYAEMISSVLGQSALADGIVNEEEEDEAWSIIEKFCFGKTGLFTEKIMQLGNLKKKDIKKQLIEKFDNPYNLKKISKFAELKDLEEDFYEMACIIINADKKILEAEKEFLNKFASKLDISKFDVKRINNLHLK